MECISNMSEEAKFESRVGVVKVASKKIYLFASDMRNFNRFIPGERVRNWEATKEECKFEVSPVGKASLRISGLEEYSMIKFAGDGLNGTTFFLWIQLKETGDNDTRVKLTIKAELNPVIKMMAQKPINDFLEKIVKGIEDFDAWDDATE